MRAIATIVLPAAWLGAALVTAAVVAPAAFAVLPTRALAGALVGRVLPVLFVSGAILGAITGWVAARSGRLAARRAGIVASLVLASSCLVAQLAIAPRIERLRERAGAPIDELAPTDARRLAFGRLHAASVAALGAGMLAAALGLVAGVRVLADSPAGPDVDGHL